MKKLIILLCLIVQVAVAQTLDIAVIGQGYKPNEQQLFLSDLENVKAELFIRLWQRQSQFNFIPLSCNNQFQCVESGLFEGGTCNDGKVVAAVMAFDIEWDNILVLAKKIKGGGGGAICLAGTYYHDRIHSGNVGVHELGHSLFGLQHDGGFMNMSTNQGAGGWNGTFTPAQFNLINWRLNQVGIINTPQPTITITSPANNFTVPTGGSVKFTGQATGAVQQIEIFYDGISRAVLMYWGDSERNPYCNPTDGISF